MNFNSAGVTGMWESKPETELSRRVSCLCSYPYIILVWKMKDKKEIRVSTHS